MLCAFDFDATLACAEVSFFTGHERMAGEFGGAERIALLRAMLVELNEPSLLYNLRARFETQLPYTYTGELELMCLVRPCSKGGRTEGQRLRHPL